MDFDNAHDVVETLRALEANLGSVVLGNDEAIRTIVAAVAAGGHILIQDEPGTGKTLLARSLARSVGGTFGRVQGSPDLMPSDVTGITIPDQRSGAWVFHPGPILNNVVLFDELNRATPRAQSALFEAMAERQVTVDGTTRPLPAPFVVVATQNPPRHAGTFLLPSGQLDRFWVAMSIEPLSRDAELELVALPPGYERADSLEPATTPEHLVRIQRHVASIGIAPAVADYAIGIVERLRLSCGPSTPSPRATQVLVAVARGSAALAGRSSVHPDDIKAAAPAVFAHRVVESLDLAAGRDAVDSVLVEVEVPVPK